MRHHFCSWLWTSKSIKFFRTVIGWTSNTGCGSNGQKVVQLYTTTPEKPPAIHQAERIANVMTAIGFVQNRKAVGNGNKQRGWWPSDQPDPPKRRF
jgi:hypothetical protein